MATMYQSWKDVPKSKWHWPNFSPREIACKGDGRLLLDDVAMDRLQALRTKLNRPLLITSAYRSPEYNKSVGGASNSYHMKGVAFDVRMDNQDPQEFEIAARSVGFRGFGYYPKQGFMHIDIGPERRWGTPFTPNATDLGNVNEARQSKTQSKTLQAAVVGGAAQAGAAFTSLSALDGRAQIGIMIFAAVALIAFAIIFKERIKAWADGWR